MFVCEVQNVIYDFLVTSPKRHNKLKPQQAREFSEPRVSRVQLQRLRFVTALCAKSCADDLSMNLEELRAPLSHRAQLQRYEDGRGPPGKGFRPGGRRSFDSWQVGVSIDSLFEYGMLFLGGKIAN